MLEYIYVFNVGAAILANPFFCAVPKGSQTASMLHLSNQQFARVDKLEDVELMVCI